MFASMRAKWFLFSAVVIFATLGLLLLHGRLDSLHIVPVQHQIIQSANALPELSGKLLQMRSHPASAPARPASTPADQCVVMFDNRPAPLPNGTSGLDDLPYLSLSVAANSLYARRHGYRFMFYNFSHSGCRHPALEGQWRDLPMTWCKLVVLEDAFFQGQQGPVCHSVLLLDSDAIVANVTQRIEDFVAAHGGEKTVLLGHLDEALMHNSSDVTLWDKHGIDLLHPWMFFAQPGGGNVLNAGVMIFQRGDGRRLRLILDEWWRAAVKEPAILKAGKPRPCWGNCLRNWPHEQAVFEIFVWPRFRQDVVALPLALLNGFSGEFVRHVWGLLAKHRHRIFEEVLASLIASSSPSELASAVAGALAEVSPGIVVPRPASALSKPAVRCGRC